MLKECLLRVAIVLALGAALSLGAADHPAFAGEDGAAADAAKANKKPKVKAKKALTRAEINRLKTEAAFQAAALEQAQARVRSADRAVTHQQQVVENLERRIDGLNEARVKIRENIKDARNRRLNAGKAARLGKDADGRELSNKEISKLRADEALADQEERVLKDFEKRQRKDVADARKQLRRAKTNLSRAEKAKWDAQQKAAKEAKKLKEITDQLK